MLPVVPALVLTAQAPDAAIQKILAASAAAYRNAKLLSLTMESKQESQTSTTTLLLDRNGKLAATITNGAGVRHIVADGKTIFSDSSNDKTKYVKQPGTTLSQAIDVLGRNGGAGVGLLPILLTNAAAEKMIVPGKPLSLKQDATETLDGVPCDVITAVLGNEEQKSAFRFAFGKTDHFLRRLTIGPVGGKPQITELYRISPAKPVATSFTYTPAAGAVASAPPKEPGFFDERLVVGAEPFKLVGNDLEGKAASYEDYKGKVLLVDFWATWCGPCVAELPNVIAAYQKYHEQGFEVIGISLDRESDRAKLEAFIAEKKMPWRQVYDGKFWQAANAVNYGVRAIPFTLLIGKDGKIAAVGARGEALAPAIEEALKK